MPSPVLVFALLFGLVAGGCAPAADRIIDSWPVGEPVQCADARSCDELVNVGLAGLNARDPGHPPVVRARLHREGAISDPSTGQQILMIRSGGCCQVLVVQLTDGSTRAIGVGYPGISNVPVAIPWETVLGG